MTLLFLELIFLFFPSSFKLVYIYFFYFYRLNLSLSLGLFLSLLSKKEKYKENGLIDNLKGFERFFLFIFYIHSYSFIFDMNYYNISDVFFVLIFII